ncbi:hypothetical protein ACFRQM_19415 [Streptomyces sp. NPDC056831]|uniref:hypothetical protein n=1 Tax=Streptomyces sp. NPDC056831 TaxID=3345954 RepID=UPI0036CA99F5
MQTIRHSQNVLGHGAAATGVKQIVADRRVVIRLRVTRLYGTALDLPAGGRPAGE